MITECLPTGSPADLERAVARAVALLQAGEAVALPTETVYGLAADAMQAEAVSKIFEAKERPFFDPLIVHLPDRSWLERVARITAESRDLVEALTAKFWPGPLTLVLPRQDIVPDIVTAGLGTIAVRMSAHPVFHSIVESVGQPLAAPSANRFGRISPTAAEHVDAELRGRIPLIVDAGATSLGIESTIVAVEGASLRLLRAGPVTAEEIGGVWQKLCERTGKRPPEAEVAHFFELLGVSYSAMLRGASDDAIEAPGQMKRHYAPRTPLRLLPCGAHLRGYGGCRVGSLAFSEPSAEGEFVSQEILSPARDLREAAATLFAKLRRLDEAGLDLIVAESVPETGLGIAIMDRLRKASRRG